MEPQARLHEFRAWFDRTSHSAFESDPADLTDTSQFLADRRSNSVLQLDYLSSLEILCECRYFGESASALDWAGTSGEIEQVLEWSKTVMFSNRGVPATLGLVDKLIYRLDSREDQGFEVPAALVSQFLYLGARSEVRGHFANLTDPIDRHSGDIVELMKDPNRLAMVLTGSDASVDMRDAARAVNRAFEFLIHRYELTRALDEWPVVQQSITVFLNDTAWELSLRGELIERCVDAMQAWHAFIDSEEDREALEKHIQKVEQSLSGFPILLGT